MKYTTKYLRVKIIYKIFCAKCGYKEFRPGSKKDPKKEAIIKAINVVDIKDFNKIKK